MGDLQDPKMEVLYHIFGRILWGSSPSSVTHWGFHINLPMEQAVQGSLHNSTMTHFCGDIPYRPETSALYMVRTCKLES